jgi:hypothetical protein
MDMQENLRLQTLLLETTQAQKKLLEQAVTLIESQKREEARLRQQLTDVTSLLTETASRLEGGGQRLGHEALRVIGESCRHVLAEHGAQAVGRLHQQAESTAQRLAQVADVAAEQGRQLSRAQSVLVWKSLAVLAVGAVLLTAGSSLWAWHSRQEAQRYEVEAAIRRRIGAADVVRCGEYLCAHVDAKAPRVGDKQQYQQIKPRPL